MDNNHLTIKTFMAIMAERDAAIQERNLALDERKRAFAERDIAMVQRDAALAERNSAMQERDEAIASLRFRGNYMNENIMSISELPEDIPQRGSKRGFSDQEMHHMFEMPDDSCSQSQREPLMITDTYHLPPENTKIRKVTKEAKSPRIVRKRGDDDVKIKPELTEGSSDDAQIEAWKDELGLNQISFDESAMPVPVCSCTGVPQPCYRWGNGGWQSACCTTTLSMYPLPQVTNKRYSRVGGRKMSGGAFAKLLTRLASEGYDLSTPLDLKDHWAKHGTNRYSTVK